LVFKQKRTWLKMKIGKYLKEIIVAQLLILTYVPTFIWMWDRWFAAESYYGHGILIPFVSLYVLWQRRTMLKRENENYEDVGLIFVSLGVLLHCVCALLKVYFVSGFSFVITLYGLVLFFFGKKVTKNLIFPIFFLLAMVPLPLVLVGNLIVKLKLIAMQGSVLLLNRTGFPSILDGSLIRMADSFISVGAPCSGLRSLISLLTLGVIFASLMKNSFWRRGIFIITAVPIAIGCNVLRLTMLAIVNDLYGEKAASGFFHDFSGFLVFAFAFIGLFLVGKMLEVSKNEDK